MDQRVARGRLSFGSRMASEGLSQSGRLYPSPTSVDVACADARSGCPPPKRPKVSRLMAAAAAPSGLKSVVWVVSEILPCIRVQSARRARLGPQRTPAAQ